TTRSRLLDDELIGQDDVAIARRAREAIGTRRVAEANPTMLSDPIALERAKKVQAYFSQPFFVAEPYTKRSGSHVSRASALRDCHEILGGRHDEFPRCCPQNRRQRPGGRRACLPIFRGSRAGRRPG